MKKKKSILLVEDEEITAHMQSKQLEKKGYAVKHLLTGEEAVEYTLKNSPSLDLILMDIDLGDGMYGTDAAKQILEKTDIPIVFLSSHTSREIVEKAEQISSYGYVIKNAGIAVLDASIKMALRLFDAKKESEKHKNKLKLSEEKYRKLTENTETILWEFDISKDKWVHVSPQVERILGYKPVEWTNLKFWTDNLHPDDRDWAAKYCAECTSKGEDHFFEYRFRKKNGEYAWLHDDVKVEVENGEPVKMWGSMIDITERKNAMEALRKSEMELKEQNEEYQALNEEYTTLNEELQQINEKLAHSRDLMQYIIEHNRSAVAVHDKDLKYIYVSQRYLDEFKVRDENIIGKHHYEVFPDLPQKWRVVHQKALKGIVSSAENDPYYKEDGTVEWTRWECRPWHESDGSIGGFIIYTEVITDRINTEKALQKSEERLDLAMSVKNEGIWDWNLITNETYFDDRYYTMAGYQPGEYPHKFEAWAKLVHPDDLAEAQTAIKKYLSGESPIFNIEFRFRKKDSDWMWINGKGKIVERDSNDKPIRIVGTHTDITGRKMAEQALNKSELELKKQNDEYYAINEEYQTLNEELNDTLEELAESNNRNKSILNAIPDLIFIFSKDGLVIDYVAPDSKKLFHAPEDFLNNKPGGFMPHDVAEHYNNAILKLFETDTIQQFSYFENYKNHNYYFDARIVKYGEDKALAIIRDVTEIKQAEEALIKSEQRVKAKLNAILQPEGDFSSLELKDIMDIEAIQDIMDDFYKLTNIGVAIVDLQGQVMVATGWQDICTKFHRTHSEASQNCIESDIKLASGVQPGKFKVYKCKNNMWDIATPITVGDVHFGNLYLGQFLFEEEKPDYEVFRKQAKKYGFDEDAYIKALEKVPRWNKETINIVMSFYSKFAYQVSVLSYSNLKLARTLEDNKKVEQALRDSEQKYRTLLENAFDGVYLLHGRGFEYVNKQFCKLTGYSYRELMKDNFDFGVLLTDKAKMLVEQRSKDREEGRKLDSVYEFQIKTKKGEVKDVEVSTTSLRGKDMPLILGILRDITKHKKNQKLEREVMVAKQAAEFKQKFLANMSHEIRTPLSGMLGFVDLLADTRLKEEQKLYVDTLRQSGENLREIINLILDYSKIESGQITLKHKTFALKSVFDNVAGLFSSICHKEIELKTTISRQIPKYINTDRNRLNQILNNLVSNAVKFTEKGTITVNAKLAKPSGQAKLFPENGSVMIKIEVKDTGLGIDPVFQKELFKPFSQADTGEVRHFEGTGLGLSICKELAEMLGGEIGVISKPGKGSNFWFTFKAKVAKEPVKKSDDIQKQVKDKEISACNVLLVDDRNINQVVVSLMLKSNGHKVDTANNGLEAIEKFKPGKYDIILMDIQMPVMDGITATKKLKQKYKKLPPVVGLSANAMEGDREKFMRQGMDEYLTKPIKKEDFDRIVDILGVGEQVKA